MPPVEVSSATSYASPSTHGCWTRTTAVCSRPIGCSAPENCANASLTTACAIVTASGPSLRTVSSITPGVSFVRSTASSSAGGPRRSARPGPSSTTKAPIATAISSQRDEAQQPRRHAAGAQLGRGGGVGLHQLTSKKPCHPSSVNSDWWAWNMNLPGCANRHSRIPRWPWHSITVSVNSDGVFDVPVGK